MDIHASGPCTTSVPAMMAISLGLTCCVIIEDDRRPLVVSFGHSPLYDVSLIDELC